VNALPFMLETPRAGAGWLMSNLQSTLVKCASHDACCTARSLAARQATVRTFVNSVEPLSALSSLEEAEGSANAADHAIPVS